jgi:hypothetical protein
VVEAISLKLNVKILKMYVVSFKNVATVATSKEAMLQVSEENKL